MRPSRFRYAHIDPLNAVGPVLDARTTADQCCCLCCRCDRKRGIYWALGTFTVEAVWHVTISCLRPAWEWNSSNLTFIAFFMQNLIRILLLMLTFQMWRALRAGKDGLAEARSFLRFLIFLLLLEVIELSIKFIEVHTVCDAPEVWARRAAHNGSGLTESQCELIADLYDYFWGSIVLLILVAVTRTVHSHIVALGGNTWSDARPNAPPRPQQPADAGAELPERAEAPAEAPAGAPVPSAGGAEAGATEADHTAAERV